MDDISYFDFKCEKLSLVRKYLHFLHPATIAFILLATQPKNQQQICDEINKSNLMSHDMTVSRLSAKLRQIRFFLHDLQRYANIFGVHESIQTMSLEDLKKIAFKYKESSTDE